MQGISSKALPNTPNNRFKYNGIEYENSFDINIGEAFFRTHDPQIGRWWQIDPKSESDRENITPFNCMSNNPISRLDPMGDLDNYKLRRDGQIELVEKTEDKTDKLFATNNQGEIDQNKSIEVKKGILDTKKEDKTTNPETSKETKTSTITVVNDKKGANKLFEFIAKNAKVEYGVTHTKTGDGKTISGITTSFEKFQNLGQSNFEYNILKNQPNTSILESIHSHPNNDNPQPSGFYPNGQPKLSFGGDRATAEYWEKYYTKGVILRKVYVPSTKTYYQFNSKGFTKE